MERKSKPGGGRPEPEKRVKSIPLPPETSPNALAVRVSEAVAKLEERLGNGADPLRRELRAFIEGMTADKPGPLMGAGVKFEARGKPSISIGWGEKADNKISLILDNVVSLAQEDLQFLKIVRGRLESGKTLSAVETERLSKMLDGNLYWRFVTPT
ncbi:MAG: hypothetical protein AB1324_04650 [Candidatus Micrarchaeota archaeon]